MPNYTTEKILIASGARTSNTFSADQTNAAYRGIYLTLNVTVASGTGGVGIRVEWKDLSGNYLPLHNSMAAKTSTGTFGLYLYPGAATANGAFNDVFSRSLPRTWRVTVTHGDASSYTYSVQYCLLP